MHWWSLGNSLRAGVISLSKPFPYLHKTVIDVHNWHRAGHNVFPGERSNGRAFV
jgi:hypothetical protein